MDANERRRYLVLGAGRMGRAIAWDLARQPGTASVTIVDSDGPALRRAARFAGSPSVRARRADASRPSQVEPLMRRADAAVSAVPYFHNEGLARAAVRARCHFCDLGGNDAVVRRELALDAAARRAGVAVVPDCGLAPGMTQVLAAHGIGLFDRVGSVRIRVGGLPLRPRPPMNYQLVFSVEGLINEYVEPCRALRGGRIVWRAPMSDLETLDFPAPFGRLEAFNTSGGTSTLPDTYRGRIPDLDYKTIRYPGHCAQFKLLMDLGLTDGRAVRAGGARVSPREMLAERLVKALPSPGPDAVLIRVTLDGVRGGRGARLILQCVDLQRGPFTAMMRTTAFPAAIVAGMLARGDIRARGAVPQERCVPTGLFLKELARRKIRIALRWTFARQARRRAASATAGTRS